jgi:hypothetical protein
LVVAVVVAAALIEMLLVVVAAQVLLSILRDMQLPFNHIPLWLEEAVTVDQVFLPANPLPIMETMGARHLLMEYQQVVDLVEILGLPKTFQHKQEMVLALVLEVAVALEC